LLLKKPIATKKPTSNAIQGMKRMRSRFNCRPPLRVILIAGLSLGGCNHIGLMEAQPEAQVDWVGTFTAQAVVRIDDPNSITGKRTCSYGVKLETTTTHILGILDTSFGVGYKIVGPRSYEPMPLRVVWRYPAIGLLSPITGRTLTSSFDQTCLVNRPCYSGKHFTESWELVRGTWIMEIWAREQLLLRQAFEVSVM
jgi:hypothetical protein